MSSITFEFNGKQYTIDMSAKWGSKKHKFNPLMYIIKNSLYLECTFDVLDEFISKNKQHINKFNSNNKTSLMLACKTNNITLIKLLLKHGADVDASEPDGTTALMIYSSININTVDENIIRLLLEAGADVNATNIHGHTALLKICDNEKVTNETIPKMLLEAGARVNLSVSNGITPLLIRCSQRKLHNKNIIKLLLEAGAHMLMYLIVI